MAASETVLQGTVAVAIWETHMHYVIGIFGFIAAAMLAHASENLRDCGDVMLEGMANRYVLLAFLIAAVSLGVMAAGMILKDEGREDY